MNSKRVKLQVASACTAALMVGCMMASSTSVFAIIGESNIVRATNVELIRTEQVEAWFAELRQLSIRFQSVINAETIRRGEQLMSARAELLRLQTQRDNIMSQIAVAPDPQALVVSLRLIDVQILGQNSIIQTILQQIQEFNQEVPDRGAEIGRQYHEFEQETAELIRLQEARENIRFRLEESPDDMNLANLLRLQELRVSHQEMKVRLRLEHMRNWYYAIFRVLEADTNAEIPVPRAE